MSDKDKKISFRYRNNINSNTNLKNNSRKKVNIKEEVFLSDSESKKIPKKKAKFFTLNSQKDKKAPIKKSMSLNVSLRSSAKSNKSLNNINDNSKKEFETKNFIKKNISKNKINFQTIGNKFKKEKEDKKFIEKTKNLKIQMKNKINKDPISEFLLESFTQSFDKMHIYFLTEELNELINENLEDQEITRDILANLEALKDSNEIKKKETDEKFLSIEEDLKKSKIAEQIILNEFEFIEDEVTF